MEDKKTGEEPKKEVLSSKENMTENQDIDLKVKESKTFTEEEARKLAEEEVNKYKSVSEPGIQKLTNEKKLYKKAMKELANIGDRQERLIELADDEPELAKLILDDFFDGETLEEYKDRIGYKEDLTKPEVLKRYIDRKAKEEMEKKEREKQEQMNKKTDEELKHKAEEYITDMELEEQEKVTFMEVFESIKNTPVTKGKEIDDVLELAFKIACPEKESLILDLSNKQKIAKISSVAGGKSGNSKGSESNKTISNDVDNFLKKFNLIKK